MEYIKTNDDHYGARACFRLRWARVQTLRENCLVNSTTSAQRREKRSATTSKLHQAIVSCDIIHIQGCQIMTKARKCRRRTAQQAADSQCEGEWLGRKRRRASRCATQMCCQSLRMTLTIVCRPTSRSCDGALTCQGGVCARNGAASQNAQRRQHAVLATAIDSQRIDDTIICTTNA